MKKLLIGATTMLVCVGVFAQGKLQFINNIDNLIYFTTDSTKLAAADVGKTVGGFSLAGSSAYTGAGSTIAALAGSPTLVAGLWGGLAAGSMTLQTTTTIDGVNFAGQIVGVQANFATLPAGTPAFFQVQIYDSRTGNALDSGNAGYYWGQTDPFTATPQEAVYSPIYFQAPSPVASGWAPGTFVPVDYAGFSGYFGGIALQAGVIPEPGTFALAGLGIAALLVFRRRK
jgi:hypothetical protein